MERALQESDYTYSFLDEGSNTFEVELSVMRGILSGHVRTSECLCYLEEVAAVYTRLSGGGLRGSSSKAAAFHRRQGSQALFQIWLDMTSARVVNRPCEMGSNSSKTYRQVSSVPKRSRNSILLRPLTKRRNPSADAIPGLRKLPKPRKH